APVIETIPTQTIDEDETVTATSSEVQAILAQAISDVDGDDVTVTLTLTYPAESGLDPEVLVIDPEAEFSWQPLADFNGTIVVEVSADDGTAVTTSQFDLVVTPVNDAPVIAASASVSVAENSTAVTTVAATDVDGPALTYSIVGGDDAAKFTINATTGALAFTAAPDYEAPTDVGGDHVYDVTVQVSDGAGGTATQAIAVEVTNVSGTESSDAAVITGTNEEDVLTGGPSANTLLGLGGADTLTGDAGNDYLDGGTGSDSMAGNAGNDNYVVDNVGDVVTEAANEGTDKVYSSISYTLTDNVENLNLTGTGAIDGTGNALNNTIGGNGAINVLSGGGGNDVLYGLGGADTLNGGGGNDYLDGGSGADVMAGGIGDDNYVVDDLGDVVTEAANEGTDRVYASVSYTLGANLEYLNLTGTGAINGTGNGLGNTIAGNDAVNVLSGGDGNDVLHGFGGADTLNGGEGNDYLDGGVGADVMAGNAGDDNYVVDDLGDVVTEAANEGTERVYASISYALGANLEYLNLTGAGAINGTGNALNNTIGGNDANNVLSGGEGNDNLNGLAGDDTLYGDAGNDILYGKAGLDNLNGGDGNDYLDGGIDADVMSGGIGDDNYLVDNAGDVVTEAADEGTDKVYASISYTLTDNVENLNLTGTGAIDGTGNALNNTIGGNDAINVLSGGGGNDVLYGLGGADTLNGDDGNDYLDGGSGADAMAGGVGDDNYVVDNVGDVVTEAANEGIDRVYSSISYTLADNVEYLNLTGTGVINGTGNALNNTIAGNSAANVLGGGDGNDVLLGLAGADTLNGGEGNDYLDGGSGADAMTGGIGDDKYVVDDAGDVVTEAADGGIDLVYASIDYTLAPSSNVENLTLIGSAAINGTGNAFDNMIEGNTAENILTGGGGNDTFVFDLDFGPDTITDFDADSSGGQDKIDISELGITAADFAGQVSITDLGAHTLVEIGDDSILLIGVNGNGQNVITQDDFLLMP
ncbi:Ig-like domain-containing protein, partial [Xanthobacteraceae bacterium Astr-EGSB]|uniref:Ig-like domain-containing protein n=1 Tax=Astrobacterium formosum TaxID=3069710 RepID=UPI0027B379DA|nr:Ig-like domain-containing protein [Xanthobacteraceae bacterium Astr-EGSB]